MPILAAMNHRLGFGAGFMVALVCVTSALSCTSAKSDDGKAGAGGSGHGAGSGPGGGSGGATTSGRGGDGGAGAGASATGTAGSAGAGNAAGTAPSTGGSAGAAGMPPAGSAGTGPAGAVGSAGAGGQVGRGGAGGLGGRDLRWHGRRRVAERLPHLHQAHDRQLLLGLLDAHRRHRSRRQAGRGRSLVCLGGHRLVQESVLDEVHGHDQTEAAAVRGPARRRRRRRPRSRVHQ